MMTMFALLEMTSLASVEKLVVSIPETVGLLAFGIGLVAAAVLTRRLLKLASISVKEPQSRR